MKFQSLYNVFLVTGQSGDIQKKYFVYRLLKY